MFLTGYSYWISAVEHAKKDGEVVALMSRALDWWEKAAREVSEVLPRNVRSAAQRLLVCRQYQDLEYDECVTSIEKDIQDFFLILIRRAVSNGYPKSGGTRSDQEAA